MTAENILFAMTDIEDTYLLSAQKAMGYGPKTSHRTRGWKRPLLVAAALLLLAAASFTTVMAANPAFREKLFAILQIRQESVPQDTVDRPITTEDMYVEDPFTIGEAITGQYVHAPAYSEARKGVYFVCTDPEPMQQGSHDDIYYEQDGAFIRLENHDFRQEYTLYGCTVTVEGTWAARDENAFFSWLPAEAPIRGYNQYDGGTLMLVEFNLSLKNAQGEVYWTGYPVLLDVRTGELIDVLAGTQAHTLPGLDQSYITPDHTKMLLLQEIQEENHSSFQLFYADLVQHQLYNVDKLSGQHTDACTLIDDVLTCWQKTGETYQIWTIDLHTLARTELYPAQTDDNKLADVKIRFLNGFNRTNYAGNLYDGACFAVLEDSTHNVFALDLKTGERTRIPGLIWPQETRDLFATGSPDGEKLLLFTWKTDDAPPYMGILDFSEKRYTELILTEDETGMAGYPYWFTNDAVIFRSEMDNTANGINYHIFHLNDRER